MLALICALIILVTVIILMTGRASPVVIFATVPVVGALAAGFRLANINKFVEKGLTSLAPIIALFVFAILFFSVMNDLGLFEPLVRGIIHIAGNNAAMVMVAAVLMAAIVHLDGAGATTYLITITTFLPIFRQLDLDVLDLLLLVGTSSGILNMEPWTAVTARAASVLNMDPVALWRPLWPVQLFGLALTVALAILLARRRSPDTRRLSPLTARSQMAEGQPLLGWKYVSNAIITLAVIAAVLFSNITPTLVFMIGFAIVLALNFPKSRNQMAVIGSHAKEVMIVSSVLFAASIFIGILSGSGMIDHLSHALLGVIPARFSGVLHLIIGFFAVPLGMAIGSDAYYFALMPIVVKITNSHGIDPASVARAMMIGDNVGYSLMPLLSSPYLLVGLAGVELGAHIRRSLLYMWLISILMLASAVVFGAVRP